VPEEFREPILRSAARWSVSPALMAGQLMAESGFDPNAGSSAGAQGIAQFMPSTAASYGLTNPYDPVAAIDAEAHLIRICKWVAALWRFEPQGRPELVLSLIPAFGSASGNRVGTAGFEPAFPLGVRPTTPESWLNQRGRL
jgi:hypothetical protein